jgi:membrane protein DedA with SNARE-associated domain
MESLLVLWVAAEFLPGYFFGRVIEVEVGRMSI